MVQKLFSKFKMNVILIVCLTFQMAVVQSSSVLFESDILIEQEMNKFKNVPSADNNQRMKRAATAKKERIWEFGVVPYVIDATVGFSGDQKAEFKEAMHHWENFTCIKFIERNASEHVNFIRFTKLECGCCSHVGNIQEGDRGQNVSIGKNCNKKGVIIHELGHAIGFWHEHTRPDRDEYVKILSENISTGHEHNFKKLTTDDVDSLGEPYDYDSIMHYANDTYSKRAYDSEIVVILPKRSKNGRRPKIGQRDRLSPSDIRQTNKLYKCPACGRTFLDPKATFTSPNYHTQSGEVFQCEWRISATHGDRIRLNITDLDIFDSNNCETNYLEIRDGYWHKSPLLGRFCGNNTNNVSVIMSTGNHMVINYVSNKAEHRGFAANYEAICGGDLTISNGNKIESPNYPQRYLPNKNCVWRISVPSGYQVAMEFQSFDLEVHPNCRNDFIEIRDGDSAKSRLIGKYCNELPPILASTSNKMYIRFVSDGSSEGRGFSAALYREIDECALKEHGCEQNCINTLDGYSCACRFGYKLRSDMKTCEVKCGGVIRAASGVIETPSFPYPYPPNEECVWEIISNETNRITLNFTHFELEGSQLMQEECDYDSVIVSSKYRDGHLVRQGIFCSELLPPPITSETNIMRIKFQSDKNVQKAGFSATFSTSIDRCAMNNGGCKHICQNTLDSIQCACKSGFVLHKNGHDCIPGECRYEITAPQGEIRSQKEEKYAKNMDCIWHFKAIHGHRPHLEFQDFDLEDDYECTNDHVTAYIGVDPSKQSYVSGDTFTLGKFCGSKSIPDSMNLPYPISSPSDDLFMAFQTDNSVQRKGFTVKHSTVCGGSFIATSTIKYIYSHARFGDTFYDDNTDCEWIIKTKQPGLRIHLKFLEFDVEHEQECLFDFVELYEQRENREWVMFGRYCGSELQLEVVSARRLLIQFQTDDADRRKGFSVSYSIATADTIRDFRSGSTRFTRIRKEGFDNNMS